MLAIGASVLALLLASLWLRERTRAKQLRARLADAQLHLQRLERSFARFAPPQIVDRIIATGDATGGEKKEVTVLFADLAGFTRLSERVEPAVLVGIVNGYFERMNRVVAEHRGYVAALLGDGLLAFFGALDANPWQSDDAAHAALAIRTELAAYNRRLAGDGLPEITLGVGLHRGVGVAGVVGSKELSTFSVVGSTVNITARVQDLTRAHGVDILLTQPVRDVLDPRFVLRELPADELRGVAARMTTFALEAFAGD
jgi:class 3 adenylate cyclase